MGNIVSLTTITSLCELNVVGVYDERQWSDEPIKDFRWLCIEEDGKKIRETKTLTPKGSLF